MITHADTILKSQIQLPTNDIISNTLSYFFIRLAEKPGGDHHISTMRPNYIRLSSQTS